MTGRIMLNPTCVQISVTKTLEYVALCSEGKLAEVIVRSFEKGLLVVLWLYQVKYSVSGLQKG